MTNMRMKPVAQRAAKRNRKIEVIDHFRKRYNCTAAQVFPIAQDLETQNLSFQEQIRALRLENQELKSEVQSKDSELSAVKEHNQVLQDSLMEAESKIPDQITDDEYAL